MDPADYHFVPATVRPVTPHLIPKGPLAIPLEETTQPIEPPEPSTPVTKPAVPSEEEDAEVGNEVESPEDLYNPYEDIGTENVPTSVLSALWPTQVEMMSLFPRDGEGKSVAVCDSWDSAIPDKSNVDCWGTAPFVFCRMRNVLYINRTFVAFSNAPARYALNIFVLTFVRNINIFPGLGYKYRHPLRFVSLSYSPASFDYWKQNLDPICIVCHSLLKRSNISRCVA